MEELQDFSEKKDSGLDLKAEIYKYLKYWYWLVIGCLLGLAVAYLYNRYTIPEYATEASMMILSKEDNNVVGALPSGGSSVLSLQQNTLDNQIETLKSKRLVEKVVDELDLNISYFIEGKVIAVEVYKNPPVEIEFLSPEKVVHESYLDIFITPRSGETYTLVEEESQYSKVHRYGEPVELNGVEFTISPKKEERSFSNTVNIKVQPLRYVANDYVYRMNIFPKGAANDILSLYVTGPVPEKSQDFLNSLMFHFNADGVADKRQVAENTAAFIQERLEIISGELDSVEGGIAEFKRENRIMDISSSAGKYMAKSSQAEQKIFELETQLMILNALKETLTSAKPYRLLPTDMQAADGGVSSLITQYNILVLERNAYLKTSTTKNPLVEGITEELDALKDNLLDNIETSKQSINIQLRELNQLDRQAEGQFSTFPGLEKGIRTIERQQQIKEQLYLFLLQRREESAISFAATGPVAKVIDPAFTYNNPVDPEPWLILTGGGVIGFIIPLLIIFGVNFLDTKVHHKGDLKPLTDQIPFLGEIPKVASDQNEVIQVNDRSPLAESFRILRTNLAYFVQSRNREKAEVIFVTSTIKGEGKTFVSFNLARTLASTNKKILLIGADIRNPKLQKYSEEKIDSKGLSDYLYDYDTRSADIINETQQDGIPVDVIFSGAIPPNPAELLMNDRLKKLLREEEMNYDYIIVDTAPTMIVTDTLLISPLADTTIYVTRAGYTDKKLLEFPRDLKEQGKLQKVTVVLNDVDYKKFSYGGKYGYAYGYGYGYGVDEEKGLKKYFTRKKQA
ncbi:capsular exopolysaccharide family [Salinimicrobium catena]|uniref:non-specific protein-tyrosine kinase n=1 Tax=Salinimicrobium catena TaxID=390640 RepID=A0A1H5LLR3_9FLAO|nr:tyrosine-protein kinase family protein [Salinimicrobium catena]SDL11564.1 capsular exopolysaccharide family [Salinimicrobium catena]SEE78013.1 capsular exopolysaccharide family [Salinimicrobium catena]